MHLHQVLLRGLSLSKDLSYGRTYFRVSSGAILIPKGPQDSQDVLLPAGEILSTKVLAQLVLRTPGHNQDLNEPCACRAVLFQGKGRKLSVCICYNQHSAELQVSWPSAEDLLLHTRKEVGQQPELKIAPQSEWWVLGLSVLPAQ